MFFASLVIMILWTWGLTPIWVNVVGTILMSIIILIKVIKGIVDLIKIGIEYDN